MTGIWVDTSKAPEIHSVNDLFDPKYSGKVTMLAELRETVPLVMLAEGVDPANASTDEWLHAIERLKDAASSGQIRRFGGNEYTEDLTAGNIVAAIGWSGDASLIENEKRRMADADRGAARRWSENMVIPVGAPQHRPRRSPGWNFVYRTGGGGRHHRIRRIHLSRSGRPRAARKTGGRNSPRARSSSPTEAFTRKCTGQNTPPDWNGSTRPGRNVLTG
jgi:hypothetical protein